MSYVEHESEVGNSIEDECADGDMDREEENGRGEVTRLCPGCRRRVLSRGEVFCESCWEKVRSADSGKGELARPLNRAERRAHKKKKRRGKRKR